MVFVRVVSYFKINQFLAVLFLFRKGKNDLIISRDYNDVPEVFDRIKSVASSKIVDQVKAIYLFDVDRKFSFPSEFEAKYHNTFTIEIFLWEDDA